MMPARADSHEALVAGFAWSWPARLNMAVQACDAWAARDPGRVALIDLSDGARRDLSHADLALLSRRVQAALAARGVRAGDRVGVLLSQTPLCAAAHLAIWRMGAVSVPLFVLFGEDALRTRLADSGAACVVTDAAGAARVAPLGVAPVTEADLGAAAEGDAAPTGPDTPACLIYTSGTTGAPKGALHGHRVLTGHLPGVGLSHDFLGAAGDVLWTPADWAWIGGLFDVLMPGLALGVPVVAARMARFDIDQCLKIIADASARNVFFPPSALRMLRAGGAAPKGLRSVASGGEPLGPGMAEWGRTTMGVTINEFYGQTECNMVASSCAALFPPQPGAIGRAVPGFDVAVLDPEGAPTDDEGDITVRRGAGSMMLGYWNRPDATAAAFRGDWLVTGDRGRLAGGFLHFVGRADDVITSAGYRIGPSEIEDCLTTHPDVAAACVVGKPDALRTQIVKAYVVPRTDRAPDPADLQDWVKRRLAAHLYPREIAFVDALPTTVTGKVVRRDLRDRAIRETGETP